MRYCDLLPGDLIIRGDEGMAWMVVEVDVTQEKCIRWQVLWRNTEFSRQEDIGSRGGQITQCAFKRYTPIMDYHHIYRNGVELCICGIK